MNEVSVDVRKDDITKIEKIGMMLMESSEAMAYVMPKTAVMVIAKDLESEDLHNIREALLRCRRECSGRLSLKDIRERMPRLYPTPNEAWAQAVASRFWEDQSNRDGMLRAIVESFPLSIWMEGDKFGSRLAFVDSYRKNIGKYGGERVYAMSMLENHENTSDYLSVDDLKWKIKYCDDAIKTIDATNFIGVKKVDELSQLKSHYQILLTKREELGAGDGS